MLFHEAIRKEKKKFTYQLPAQLATDSCKEISFWGFHEKIVELLFEEIFLKGNYKTNCTIATPVFIDCGANIGLSLLYLKLKHPGATIHAFEPDAETFSVLKENIALNKLSDIHLHQKAVSTTNQQVSFYVNENINALPLMSLAKNELASHETKVDAISFADFIDGFDHIDFCKLDIEGAESAVAENLFNRNLLKKANQWIVEYHPWFEGRLPVEKFVSLFQSSGFEVEIIEEQPTHPAYPTSGNTLYRFYRK